MENEEIFSELLNFFLGESQERLETIESLALSTAEASPERKKEIKDEIKRELHTLKGNAGMMGFSELREEIHGAETFVLGTELDEQGLKEILARIESIRRGLKKHSPDKGEEDSDASAGQLYQLSSVRISFDELERILERMSDILVLRNRMLETLGACRESIGDKIEVFETPALNLNKALTVLTKDILRLRLIPLDLIQLPLKKIVFEESAKRKKKARLEMQGLGESLDKSVFDVINEVLGHIVRNSIAHGIEDPAARAAKGKDETGTIIVSVRTLLEEIVITVTDDGKGIDEAQIIEKAKSLGVEVNSFQNALDIIFSQGYSTAEEVDISAGRGFGLSAVQLAVSRIGGRVSVQSEKDRSTTFMIRLPLNLTIITAMLFKVGELTVAFPVSSVVHVERTREKALHSVNNSYVYLWNGQSVHLLDLRELLSGKGDHGAGGFVVIIKSEEKQKALLLDDVRNIEDIAVRKNDLALDNSPYFSACTILSDGRVGLIVDPSLIIEKTASVDPQSTAP